MSSSQDKCPACGAELAGGLCPQCLLLAGMDGTRSPGRAGWTPPTPEELQAQLAQYEVLELLGHGGMGAVYKGWQTSLERLVAIKVLPPALTEDDLQFTTRFRHEAKTMARLSHPDIVSVYDFGETADSLCYIVMEFIEGTDVQQLIASQGLLPPAHALAIAMHVCDALACAHEHGIIHRDIKPANVMVDMQGRVKVTDFGLAKATNAGAALFTRTNLTMGTPGYVAPEALIQGINLDERADLYAVGVMLYAMLTGRVPQGRFETACARVPGLDPRFDEIVNRAMQDRREARYASAADLRADLSTILTAPLEQEGALPGQAADIGQLREGGSRIVWLMGIAAAAVGVLGLFLWRPWSNAVGLSAVAGVQPTNQIAAREAVLSKEQGDVAKPSEKPIAPQVAAARSIVPGSKISPITTSSIPGIDAASGTPKPNEGPSSLSVTSIPKQIDAAAGKSVTPKPQPIPSPGNGGTPVAAASVPINTALPAELASLDIQFQKLQSERVTAPFEADVANLNAGYVGGLGREMVNEKAAGHLDAVLALEAEKMLIRDKHPVPSREEEEASTGKTPEGLKKLRMIYRASFAKLEEKRLASLKPITEPLTARLVALESDLTKKDRIADAKMVRRYRESLGSALAGDSSDAGVSQGMVRTTLMKSITPTANGEELKDGFTNTLGMKFVHVPGTKVFFCIHITRVKDYAVYAAEVQGVNATWKTQARDGIPISRGEEYPVVGVDWEEAKAFCAWLSKKEGHIYRLPTDREWSFAVGLGLIEQAAKDATPESLNGKVPNAFPWGTQWPPPKGAGNYADTACKAQFPSLDIIEGYTDGFATTSPVESFKPNKLGLHDMGGNVLQWCEDWYNSAQKERVSRGGYWDCHTRDGLLSSTRIHGTPDIRIYRCGFRCVIVAETGSPAPAPQIVAAPRTGTITPAAAVGTLADGFTNTLGMKFKHVSGAKVLFCIHTTRVKDYAAYAAEVPGLNGEWKTQTCDGTPVSQGDDFPVVGVSWDDGNAFCAWLSKKEGHTYRLPTDREWSIAVGIGQSEKETKDISPESLSGKGTGAFPWGSQWPPPKGAGNFADTTCKDKFPSMEIIAGYTDGFPTTSPVMSFRPNTVGLYDMGGNVYQWCEDWINGEHKDHVLRGSNWHTHDRAYLHSANRHHLRPNIRGDGDGFRIVVVSNG